jgi:hypothetical protein
MLVDRHLALPIGYLDMHAEGRSMQLGFVEAPE